MKRAERTHKIPKYLVFAGGAPVLAISGSKKMRLKIRPERKVGYEHGDEVALKSQKESIFNMGNHKFKGLITFIMISLTVFISLAYRQAGNQLTDFDQTVSGWIVAWRTPWLTGLMLAITQLGSTGAIIGVLVAGTIAGLFWWRRFEVIIYLVSTAGAYWLSETLKQICHRDRPSMPWLERASGYSFPSGHSLVSLVLYWVLAYLMLRNLQNRIGRNILAVGLLMLPFLIGISRIYLGVHYPSDVLGGWAFAMGWVGIWVAVVDGYIDPLKT
jgi:undecaprenyl-diphosphatase